MNKQTEILGVLYDIITDEELDNVDGKCDTTTKQLHICSTLFDAIENPKPNHKKKMQVYIDKVIRHELIHAMAFESGLAENSPMYDELVIDWIAIMYPRMKQIFEKLNIEE